MQFVTIALSFLSLLTPAFTAPSPKEGEHAHANEFNSLRPRTAGNVNPLQSPLNPGDLMRDIYLGICLRRRRLDKPMHSPVRRTE